MDYISWAQEYESDAQIIREQIQILRQKLSSGKLSVDEKYSCEERIRRLNSYYHELRLTAKHLRERGEKYNA